MFSFSEIIFLLVLALVIIGPKQLPELARNIGRFLNEVKRASSGLTREFTKPLDAVHPLKDDKENKT